MGFGDLSLAFKGHIAVSGTQAQALGLDELECVEVSGTSLLLRSSGVSALGW